MERFLCQNEVKKLKQLCDKLNVSVYIVGGYTRELLSGIDSWLRILQPSDVDVCGDFCADIFKKAGATLTNINKSLGTARVTIDDKFSFEYTRFRVDSYDSGGAHTPSKTQFVTNINQDACRRDFTINAIYYDVVNNQIIDPLGGVADLEAKTIRCHNPSQVFCSDGLRLLRLVRLASQNNYKIDRSTLYAAKKYRANLADIAPDRKRDELNKILLADTKYGIKYAHYNALKLVTSLQLWDYLIPQINQLKIPQNPKYHKYDVLEHTLKTVKYSSHNIRLLALLHDIGKPQALINDGNMHNHATIGADMAKQILTDLRYSKKEIQNISHIISIHMFDADKIVKDSKMRLFCVANYDYLNQLQLLAMADGKATGYKTHEPRFWNYQRKLIKCKAPLSIKDLKIDGDDCINAGLSGSQISKTLNELWRECILNVRLNNRNWLLAALKQKTQS